MPMTRHPRSSGVVNRGHPLNRGRLAWWLTIPGRYGGGTWSDLMGLYPGTMTAMGDSSNGWRPSTRAGGHGAVRFSSGYVAAPSIQVGPSFTVGVWCRPAVLGSYFRIVETDYATEFYLGMNIAATSYFWIISDAGVVGIGGGSPTVGVWDRVVATYHGPSTVTALYVNGVPVASGTHAAPATSILPVYIGMISSAPSPGSTYGFVGDIDDVSLWSRALSAADVRADFDLSRRGYPGVLNRLGSGATTLYGAAAAGGGGAAHVFRRTLYRRAGSRGAS